MMMVSYKPCIDMVYTPYLCIVKIITTSKAQKLDSSNKCATLLVLSPNHGRDKYAWEWQDLSSRWVQILVPSHTCLPYASNPGKYRCIVQEEMFTFTVIHGGKRRFGDNIELCYVTQELNALMLMVSILSPAINFV